MTMITWITSLAVAAIAQAFVTIGGPTVAAARTGSFGVTDTVTRAGGATKDAMPKLRASIDSAIQLLDDQQFVPFLARFISPDQKKVIFQKISLDDLALQFQDEKAGRLLSVLKEVRKKKPRFDATAMTATFKCSGTGGWRDTIVFMLVEGVWYLRN